MTAPGAASRARPERLDEQQPAARGSDLWPALPWTDWEPTISTVHLWSQIVGKVRLALTPPINHWWHVPLRVSPRGLTSGPIPSGGRPFQIDFDFIDHRLTISDGHPGRFEMALEPKPVATFYGEFLEGLRERGIRVRISRRPVELEDVIPFDEDLSHASYEREHVHLLWRALVSADRVLNDFRSRFVGKASPVHFFWGGFDLASTRFSGRPAPRHPGGVPNCPDWVMEEAYSHEVWSAGWWPLSRPPGPSFYAYAYPEPAGFSRARVRPTSARYEPGWREFLLPYDDVTTADDPDAVVLEFLASTYEAAADFGAWDRVAVEAGEPPMTPARRPWSVSSPGGHSVPPATLHPRRIARR